MTDRQHRLDRETWPQVDSHDSTRGSTAVPGKRTLTMDLVYAEPAAAPVQRKVGAGASGVRLHRGSEARSIGVLGYTQGSELHFAPDLAAEPPLQLLRALAPTPALSASIPSSGGAPLPDATRATMERSFGADFSSVRVHVGDHARAVGAVAFAQGEHLHFASGAFDPGSREGTRVLAHELAHVVQQRDGRVSATGTISGYGLNDDPALEVEADRAAERVLAGELLAPPRAGRAPEATTPLQRMVGSQLVDKDPVLIITDDDDAEPIPGTIVGGYRSGYFVKYTDEHGKHTEFLTIDRLDFVDEATFDYEGRNALDRKPHQIPGHKENRKYAQQRKGKRTQRPTEARDAWRGAPKEKKQRLVERGGIGPKEQQAINEMGLDSQPEAELVIDVEQSIPESNITGNIVVQAGAVGLTFRPHGELSAPPGRKGWDEGGVLELEIYKYGLRVYHVTCPALDGGVLTLMITAHKRATVHNDSVQWQGRSDWSGTAEAPVHFTAGKGEQAERYDLTIVDVISETYYCRDEDGLFYVVKRHGDGAKSAALTAEATRTSSGGGGAGFATVRTDLASADSYVWFGPEPKQSETGGEPELRGFLDASRWRGSCENGLDYPLVYFEDGIAFCRTNTPVESRYLYYKSSRRQLRWFGDPMAAAQVQLRKPDYGGPFTEELDQDAVVAQMKSVAEQLETVQLGEAEVAIPKGVQVWLLEDGAPAANLYSVPGEDRMVRATPEKSVLRKKSKGRELTWVMDADEKHGGYWKRGEDRLDEDAPTPGWPTRTNPEGRSVLMEGRPATGETRKPSDEGGLGAPLTHPRQEWCHLVGHGDTGTDEPDNLVAGSHYANTEQLAMETAARAIRNLVKKNDVPVRVLLKVTAYLHDETNIAEMIRYKVYLERTDDDVESVKIFDHVYDGQLQSFDRNEFEILAVTLEEQGKTQLLAWGMEIGDEDKDEDKDEMSEGEESKPALGKGAVPPGKRRLRAHERFLPANAGPELPSGNCEILTWDTIGDNNCAFNGFAMVLMNLVHADTLTPGDISGKLNGVDNELVIELAALVPHVPIDPAAARRIQKELAEPLREAAVNALAGTPVLWETIRTDFLVTIQDRVLAYWDAAILRPPGDLFNNPGSPLVAAIHNEVDEIISGIEDQFGEDIERQLEEENDVSNDLLSIFAEDHLPRLIDYFDGEGMAAYIQFMFQDQVWAGAPELNALANYMGVHLVTFRRAGQLRGEVGRAFAGEAQVSIDHVGEGDVDFTRGEIATLKAQDLIEGDEHHPGNLDPRISFKIATREQVIDKIGPPDDGANLCARFLALYDAHYRHRDDGEEPNPIWVGMRHEGPYSAHWSAVTTAGGAAELGSDAAPLAAMEDAPPLPGLVDGKKLAGGGKKELPPKPTLSPSSKSEPPPSKPEAQKASVGGSGGGGKMAPTGKPFLGGPSHGVPITYANVWFGEKQHDGAYSKINFAKMGLDPKTDVIGLVNAAKGTLTGGGGIDGAIHNLAGKAIDHEAALWLSNPMNAAYWNHGKSNAGVGKAMSTSGGKINTDVPTIIHSVGPFNGKAGEQIDDLRSCVVEILREADAQGCTALIMCNISSDKFGFDSKDTANVIHEEIGIQMAKGGHTVQKIVFNSFPPPDKASKLVNKVVGADLSEPFL